jgi:hypothetical protein
MQLSTYGNALLIFRVSKTVDDLQELINAKGGNLKAVSDELMDLHKMRKRRLEAFHMQHHPKYFFHIMDQQLKLILRFQNRRFTFNQVDLNEDLSLFPVVDFKTIQAKLPQGVFRTDYIRGPLTTQNDTKLEDIKGYRWINNPFDRDLVQFNPGEVKIRTDNQVIYREFIINDQSPVQQTKR